MPTVSDIISDLDHFAPLETAADWDNVGLLIGDSAFDVRSIVTCLTVTPEVVDEAIARKADLIVTHHPMLFRGAKRLTSSSTEGRMVLSLVRHGIAVFSPHTAFDNCVGGINDMLADRLGLTDIQPLRPRSQAAQCKIVVFMPDTDLERVSSAMFAAGAGRIGNYDECSFRMNGTGTFHGNELSKPVVGRAGRREEVAESRLEVVCPESRLQAVVSALRSAHSYEEPAFDIYTLKSASFRSGEGRLGQLTTPMPLADLAGKLKVSLACGPVQYVGEGAKPITSVAIACGAAGEFLADAQRARADAFITGEMRFHDYLTAKAQGIGLILPGHYATERFALEELARQLAARWPGIAVQASEAEREPVAWV